MFKSNSKCHPLYDTTPFVVTVVDMIVTEPALHYKRRDIPVIQLLLRDEEGNTDSLFFNLTLRPRIQALFELLKITNTFLLEELIGKRFGVKLNEECGFVTHLLNEDLSVSIPIA